MSNDDLWGALSSDKNPEKSKSLDEIMAEDASGKSQGTSIKTDTKSRRGALIAGGTALVIAMGGLFFVSPWSGADLFGQKTEESAPQVPVLKESPGPTTKPTEVPDPWYTLPENLLPIDEPKFATELATLDAEKITEEQKQWVQEQVGDTRLGTVSSINLPSEAQGYTSNPKDATDKNGLPNPNFSYWTAELFTDQSTLITNKLLNPVYGGWTKYQYASAGAAKNFDVSMLGDVFTAKYGKQLQKNKAATPVYADWKSNNYGMGGTLLNSGGPRWVGEITDANIVFNYDKKILGYTADATYKIKFTSWTQDQKKVTKNGVLKVKFVPDNSAVENPHSFRVLIDSGSLSVS